GQPCTARWIFSRAPRTCIRIQSWPTAILGLRAQRYLSHLSDVSFVTKDAEHRWPDGWELRTRHSIGRNTKQGGSAHAQNKTTDRFLRQSPRHSGARRKSARRNRDRFDPESTP